MNEYEREHEYGDHPVRYHATRCFRGFALFVWLMFPALFVAWVIVSVLGVLWASW
jgi:hypothetical protein